MNTNTRLALGDLKERLEKAKDDPLQHSLIVTVVELDALVTWAEEQKEDIDKRAKAQSVALTCDLVAGDDVEVAVDLGFISAGTQGLLVEIIEKHSYPYLVRFGSIGRHYIFQRHEIKRVR